jgi:hypothetical protein
MDVNSRGGDLIRPRSSHDGWNHFYVDLYEVSQNPATPNRKMKCSSYSGVYNDKLSQ